MKQRHRLPRPDACTPTTRQKNVEVQPSAPAQITLTRYPTKKMYVSLFCEALCGSDKESSPTGAPAEPKFWASCQYVRVGCHGSRPRQQGSSAQGRVHGPLRFGSVLLARNRVGSNLDVNQTLACASTSGKSQLTLRTRMHRAPMLAQNPHSKQSERQPKTRLSEHVWEIAVRFSREVHTKHR